MVDAGGSLALASRGLFSTGVSTDLNVTYLNSGGKVGDTLKGEVVCDKCELLLSSCLLSEPLAIFCCGEFVLVLKTIQSMSC